MKAECSFVFVCMLKICLFFIPCGVRCNVLKLKIIPAATVLYRIVMRSFGFVFSVPVFLIKVNKKTSILATEVSPLKH